MAHDSKRQGRPKKPRNAAMMRLTVLIAAASAMTGCTGDKQADVAACENETLRFFSDSHGDDFMVACMDAKGYRFDIEPVDCDGKSRMTHQAACYVPEGWLAGFLDEFGRPAKRTPTADVKSDRQSKPNGR
jgi:hypothetical protein